MSAQPSIEPMPVGVAATTRAPGGHPGRRLALAMGLSLAVHALLLSLELGDPGWALPHFEWPWHQERTGVSDLTVRLAGVAMPATPAASPVFGSQTPAASSQTPEMTGSPSSRSVPVTPPGAAPEAVHRPRTARVPPSAQNVTTRQPGTARFSALAEPRKQPATRSRGAPQGREPKPLPKPEPAPEARLIARTDIEPSDFMVPAPSVSEPTASSVPIGPKDAAQAEPAAAATEAPEASEEPRATALPAQDKSPEASGEMIAMRRSETVRRDESSASSEAEQAQVQARIDASAEEKLLASADSTPAQVTSVPAPVAPSNSAPTPPKTEITAPSQDTVVPATVAPIETAAVLNPPVEDRPVVPAPATLDPPAPAVPATPTVLAAPSPPVQTPQVAVATPALPLAATEAPVARPPAPSVTPVAPPRASAGTNPDATAASASSPSLGPKSDASSGPAAASMAPDFTQKALEMAQNPLIARAAMPPPGPPTPPPMPRRLRLFGRLGREVSLKAYADGWRQKTERNGSLNFPRGLRGRNYTDPIVTISIRSDGSVENLVIDRSSGVPELDEAVRKIVAMLSPYSAFPPDLARDYDIIDIRRVWDFGDTLRILEEWH